MQRVSASTHSAATQHLVVFAASSAGRRKKVLPRTLGKPAAQNFWYHLHAGSAPKLVFRRLPTGFPGSRGPDALTETFFPDVTVEFPGPEKSFN